MAKLPKGHGMSAHKDCVGQEMHRWKHHSPRPLHSGVGKKGKEGKVVPQSKQDQAIAIALSVCGKGKKGKKSKETSDHAEMLANLGFSEESAYEVAEMLNWDDSFRTGKAPTKQLKDNYGPAEKANSLPGMDIDARPGKQPGNQGKNSGDSGMIYPGSLDSQGNPQAGPRSKETKGLHMF